jgi:hypothetical protein
MSTRNAGYLDAIEHLPEGAILVVHHVSWDDYEQLLEDLSDRPSLRASYDRGKLEIRSPLENRGSATWKSNYSALSVSATAGGRSELPSLAKEGWLRPLSECCEATLAGADGVVGSRLRLSEVEPTALTGCALSGLRASARPAAPGKGGLRQHFLHGASTPPLPRRGVRFSHRELPCSTVEIDITNESLSKFVGSS